MAIPSLHLRQASFFFFFFSYAMRMVCRETSEFKGKQETDLIQIQYAPKVSLPKQDAIEARISSDVVLQRDIHHSKPERHK